MTAAEAAKQAGLSSLSEVADMTGWTTKALRDWHKENPKRFNIVLAGCVACRPVGDMATEDYMALFSSPLSVVWPNPQARVGEVGYSFRTSGPAEPEDLGTVMAGSELPGDGIIRRPAGIWVVIESAPGIRRVVRIA